MKSAPALSLELFTRVQDDLEKRQYIILDALQKLSAEFQYYKIYPHLASLIELNRTLRDIQSRLENLKNKFPKRISRIDWVNKTIEHDVVFVDGTDLTKVQDLIRWALPKIDKIIREGAALYEFVESELYVEHVGIVPEYREEGYVFIPDNMKKMLNLFQFEVSIFRSSEDQYRSLKTEFLKSLETGNAHMSPNSLKLSLIEEKRDMPNPATFAFETKLDFSFDHTILPVAKRKLMQRLYE